MPTKSWWVNGRERPVGATMRANLREPAYRQLWWSQLFGNVADAMSPVIFTLLVLASPYSRQLGMLLAFDGICFIAGLTLGGQLGRRGHTIAGLRSTHLVRAAGVVPSGLILAADTMVPLLALMLFAAASSGAAGVSQNLAGIRIAEIRLEEDRAPANGLRAAGQNAAFGLAPIFVALGIDSTGYPRAALMSVIVIVTVTAILGSLPAATSVTIRPSTPERSVGVLRVLRQPFILLLLLQGTILVLAARGPSKVLALLYLHHIGAYKLLALVSFSQFAGAIAGSLIAARLSTGLRPRLAAACFGGCALPLVAIALHPPGFVLLTAFVIAGAAYAFYLVSMTTSVQNVTDAAGLGAVYSVQGLIWWIADPIGLLIVGQTAHTFDVSTVAFGALAVLALSGSIVLLLLNRYQPTTTTR